MAEVIERLGAAQPVDAAAIDLANYRGLQPPWDDWQFVVARGRWWAQRLAGLLFEDEGGEP